MVPGRHQITNKIVCLPAPVPTEGGAGRNDQNGKQNYFEKTSLVEETTPAF
jgi:hypothetical protein